MDIIFSMAIISLFFAVIRLFSFGLASPVTIFCGLYLSCAFFGRYFHVIDVDLIYLIGDVSDFVANSAYIGILLFTGCFLFGACFFVELSKIRIYKFFLENKKTGPGNFAPKTKTVVAVTIFSISALIAGSGLSDLMIRETYMVEQNKILKSIGGLCCLFSCFFIGLHNEKNLYEKILVNSLFVLILLVFIGYSSRSVAVGMVLFAISKHALYPSKKTTLLLMLVFLFAPIVLSLPLLMRGMPVQGLIAFFENFSEYIVLSAKSGYASVLDNFLLSSFDIISASSTTSEVTWAYILTSINPLPGNWTDFYEYNIGLHPFVPYAMMGEWMALSRFAGCLFFFIIGLIFGLAHVVSISSGPFMALFSKAPLLMFALLSLQYSTRASLRPIYYFLFILAVYVFLKVKILRK